MEKKISPAWNPGENIVFPFSPLFKFVCKICIRVLGDIMEKIYRNCKIMLSEWKEREKNLNKTVLIIKLLAYFSILSPKLIGDN